MNKDLDQVTKQLAGPHAYFWRQELKKFRQMETCWVKEDLILRPILVEEIFIVKPGNVRVGFCEIVNGRTQGEIFRALSSDLSGLTLTDRQIHNFCQKFRLWLEGQVTLFLSQDLGHYSVVWVSCGSAGIFTDVDRFKEKGVWGCRPETRLVIPAASTET